MFIQLVTIADGNSVFTKSQDSTATEFSNALVPGKKKSHLKRGGQIVRLIHRMQIWRTGTSHESEASEASVFCFDNASPEKSCFVDGLLCFISLCLRVFVFLNASRRDRNFPTFASSGKQWIHGIR